MKKEYILSIETSGNLLGLGLSTPDKHIAKIEFYMPNLHDRLLAQTVKSMLTDLLLSFDDIKAVAVSAGPGSFTGLRIGLAFAKALCFDGRIKFIPVPVLDAFAKTASNYCDMLNAEKIIATVPSHKDLLYYCEYDNTGNAQGEIIMSNLADFRSLNFENTMLVGDFLEFESTYKTIRSINSLNITNIMDYAQMNYMNGLFSDASDFTPIYVQEFIPKGYKQ
jgi:tRNA threonylcarbamoyladenosine biosynthesis protein TsaB